MKGRKEKSDLTTPLQNITSSFETSDSYPKGSDIQFSLTRGTVLLYGITATLLTYTVSNLLTIHCSYNNDLRHSIILHLIAQAYAHSRKFILLNTATT